MMNTKSTAVSPVSFMWKSAILVLAVLINLTLAFRLVWGEQSVSTWSDLKDRQSSLQADLAVLDGQRAQLSREIRLLQTDGTYVEKVIRQRLNYVRGNEILYLFDDPKQEDSLWTGADPDVVVE